MLVLNSLYYSNSVSQNLELALIFEITSIKNIVFYVVIKFKRFGNILFFDYRMWILNCLNKNASLRSIESTVFGHFFIFYFFCIFSRLWASPFTSKPKH